MSNIFNSYEAGKVAVDKEFLDKVCKATISYLQKRTAYTKLTSTRAGATFGRDEVGTIIVRFFVGTEAAVDSIEDVVNNDENLNDGTEVIYDYHTPTGNYLVCITMLIDTCILVLDEYEATFR